jgi:hypothetical protein
MRAHALVGWLSGRLDSSVRPCGRAWGVAGVGVVYQSTWIKAMKNGNFSSWPDLTEHAAEKHLSKSTATVKVNLNQQRMFARSTQQQEIT